MCTNRCTNNVFRSSVRHVLNLTVCLHCSALQIPVCLSLDCVGQLFDAGVYAVVTGGAEARLVDASNQ